MELCKALQRQGIVPEIVTYSALISTCKKGKHLERALVALQSMQ